MLTLELGLHRLGDLRQRPAIGEVVFVGNDEIDKSDIEEKVSLEQGSVLSEPTVREQLDKIRQLYAEKGFFLAQVHYELEPQPNNEVIVRFVIDEGDEVAVRRIRFIGNENLTESELRAVMQTSETGFFSFLSSTNTYRLLAPATALSNEAVSNTVSVRFYSTSLLGVNHKKEVVKIKNRGHVRVNLDGWVLKNKQNGKKVELPRFILRPGKVVRIHTGDGDSTARHLFLSGRDMWGKKGQAVLKDSTGRQAAKLRY